MSSLLAQEIGLVGEALNSTRFSLSGDISSLSGVSQLSDNNLQSNIDSLSGSISQTGESLNTSINLLDSKIDDIEEEVQTSATFAAAFTSALSAIASSFNSNNSSSNSQVGVLIKKVSIPKNSSSMQIKFSDLSSSAVYNSAPCVIANIRLGSSSNNFYGHNIYGVNNTEFFVKFSETVQESNNFLDIVVYGNSSYSSDNETTTPSAISTQWFEETSSNDLTLRSLAEDTSNPAVQLFEDVDPDSISPRESSFSSNDESAQYFEENQEGDITPQN